MKHHEFPPLKNICSIAPSVDQTLGQQFLFSKLVKIQLIALLKPQAGVPHREERDRHDGAWHLLNRIGDVLYERGGAGAWKQRRSK
jgi:hypothetical protein